jgi:putative colanic acid biosynthesis acetyltransferase WcaF
MQQLQLTPGNKLLRAMWQVIWLLLYRPSPIPLHAWRRVLLRLFGATIEANARAYPSTKIWAPWNLTMRQNSCMGPYVDCYCVDKIELGVGATVSQYSYLCSASHDYMKRQHPLITAPIHVHDHAWVAADVFVGPGVTIGEGAVVFARSTVVRDIEAWMVVAGPDAKVKKRRELKDGSDSF